MKGKGKLESFHQHPCGVFFMSVALNYEKTNAERNTKVIKTRKGWFLLNIFFSINFST